MRLASDTPLAATPTLPSPIGRGRVALALLSAAVALRARPGLAHAVALLLFAAALVGRFAVTPQLGPGFPFLTFFPAIVLSTFFCGRWPGVVCSTLSVLAAWYWFIPPFGTFALDTSGTVAVAFFVFISLVDIVVIDLMLVALTRQAELQAQTDALLAQRNTLFQELQHRVANHLMVMGAVLGDQERRLAHLPEARDTLSDARRRFELLSRLHRHLYDPARLDAPIDHLLRELGSELLKGLGRPDLQLSVEADPTPLDLDPKLNLCLLVLELLTNAVKHAFPEARAGQLWVRLRREADGSLVLHVDDNGRGLEPAEAPPLPAGRSAAAADGNERLGVRIAQGLTKALRGELKLEPRPEGGTSAQVRCRPQGVAPVQRAA